MSTQIFFVRHASYKNPERLVPGRIPGYHLDDKGIEKAKKVGEYLKETNAQYIYTSPLERAFETANIISDFLKGVKITHVYELTEVDATLWQAYHLEELFKNQYYEEYLGHPDSSEITENLNALAKRMANFTNSLCEKHKNQSIICISHKDPITILRLKLEGKPLTLLNNYRVGMASISKFMFDENCKFAGYEYITL